MKWDYQRHHPQLSEAWAQWGLKRDWGQSVLCKKLQTVDKVGTYHLLIAADTKPNQWRNNSRKNEEGMEPKQKQYSVVDVTGDRSKVRCCKEQYCIGTWNVRSMNQDKLEVVKQEIAKVNLTGEKSEIHLRSMAL